LFLIIIIFLFQLYYIKGKTLDSHQEFSTVAEESLLKSVKLNPTNYGAWMSLGHSYWKKRDLQSAMNCYERSAQLVRE